MPADLTWSWDEVNEKLFAGSANMTLDVAQTLLENIKYNLVTMGPPRSLPGQWPNQDSGTLYRTFRLQEVELDQTGGVIYFQVVSDWDYAFYLEVGTQKMAPRPYIMSAIAATQSMMEDRLRNADENYMESGDADTSNLSSGSNPQDGEMGTVPETEITTI